MTASVLENICQSPHLEWKQRSVLYALSQSIVGRGLLQRWSRSDFANFKAAITHNGLVHSRNGCSVFANLIGSDNAGVDFGSSWRLDPGKTLLSTWFIQDRSSFYNSLMPKGENDAFLAVISQQHQSLYRLIMRDIRRKNRQEKDKNARVGFPLARLDVTKRKTSAASSAFFAPRRKSQRIRQSAAIKDSPLRPAREN